MRSNGIKTREILMKIILLLGYSAHYPHTAYVTNKVLFKRGHEAAPGAPPEAPPEEPPGGPPEVSLVEPRA